MPRPDRPEMPGYGIRPAEDGLLDWAWAEERLVRSHDYWLATVWPGNGPHLMPVWGVWADDDTFWFASSRPSRKIRNLTSDPRCTVGTEDPQEPVVLEGTARIVTEPDAIEDFLARLNAKYGTSYETDFVDPAVNSTVQVRPSWAFALTEEDFTGSPTRWIFD